MLDRFKVLAVQAAIPFFRAYWRLFNPKTAGARALIVRDGRVLLVKAVYNKKYLFPGGGLERGEAPAATAVRETFEETGLRATVRYKLGTYAAGNEGKRDTIHIFVADAGDAPIRKEWELRDADWYPLDALPEDTSPGTRRRIGEYLAGAQDLNGDW